MPKMTLPKLIRTINGRHPVRALDWLIDRGVLADKRGGGFTLRKAALTKLLAGATPDHSESVRAFIDGACGVY